MTNCVFCKIIAGTIPSTIIASNDAVVVFADRAPKAPTHLLLVPRAHVADIQSLTDAQLIGGEIISMAQQLSGKLAQPGGFKLQINSGASAGQEIFHLHAHFLSQEALRK